MKLSVLLLCVLANTLLTVTGQGNSTKAFCKSNIDADTCLMNLLLIGDPKFKFPENMPEMDKHCRSIKSHEKCIKEYSSKCLPTFPRQVTSVLAYGVAKTNKGYCTNKRLKDAFISIGKCGNKVKAQADQCMRKWIEEMQSNENHPDAKLRIPMSCCDFYKFKSCFLGLVEREGKPLCSESVYTEAERIVDGYAVEVLNLICGDYTEDSDKCQGVPKTPKRLAKQKRVKSILPPFITILSAQP